LKALFSRGRTSFARLLLKPRLTLLFAGGRSLRMLFAAKLRVPLFWAPWKPLLLAPAKLRPALRSMRALLACTLLKPTFLWMLLKRFRLFTLTLRLRTPRLILMLLKRLFTYMLLWKFTKPRLRPIQPQFQQPRPQPSGFQPV